ncbi:MAG: hypothetical protein ACYS0D_14600, partial [Planctomycetota bacterium]
LGALPKEKTELPREVVYGGSGGPRERALNWLPQTSSPSKRTSTPAPQPPPDDEPWPQPPTYDPGMIDEDPDDDTAPGPVSSAGDGSATRAVPRAFSTKGFWPAGRTGAGFDDPAWDASSDFVTFDEMLEVVGADKSDHS